VGSSAGAAGLGLDIEMAMRAPAAVDHQAGNHSLGRQQESHRSTYKPPVDGVDEPQRSGRAHQHGIGAQARLHDVHHADKPHDAQHAHGANESRRSSYKPPVDGVDEPHRSGRPHDGRAHDVNRSGHKPPVDGVDQPDRSARTDHHKADRRDSVDGPIKKDQLDQRLADMILELQKCGKCGRPTLRCECAHHDKVQALSNAFRV
jgi:hypothetical protein